MRFSIVGCLRNKLRAFLRSLTASKQEEFHQGVLFRELSLGEIGGPKHWVALCVRRDVKSFTRFSMEAGLGRDEG